MLTQGHSCILLSEKKKQSGKIEGMSSRGDMIVDGKEAHAKSFS